MSDIETHAPVPLSPEELEAAMRFREAELNTFGDERPKQLKDGRTFIIDAPTQVPAIWGDEDRVLWAAGEGLMTVGPQGVGKSALLQQLVNRRLGIGGDSLLGLPVKVSDKRVLYIAADRPQQIRRSWRRMVSDEDAQILEERLIVWAGPLPFDLAKEPLGLLHMCEGYGVGDVYIDSLKDIASPLTDDAVGAAVNRARGACIAAGIQYVELHHNRKATTDNRKPAALADVYGSVWLTAGTGSVISLWGEAGDPIVELTHLKQPAAEVGPLELEHDHQHGRTTLRERPTVASVLMASGAIGISAPEAAVAVYGPNPTKAQVEKVRRQLSKLAEEGDAKTERGTLRTDPVRYTKTTVEPRVVTRVAPRDLHGAPRTPENTAHGSYTHPNSSTPLLREGVEREAERGADKRVRPGAQIGYGNCCSCADGGEGDGDQCERCYGHRGGAA